jgi:hypothetical protein
VLRNLERKGQVKLSSDRKGFLKVRGNKPIRRNLKLRTHVISIKTYYVGDPKFLEDAEPGPHPTPDITHRSNGQHAKK